MRRNTNCEGSILSKNIAIRSYACSRMGVMTEREACFNSSNRFFWSFSIKYFIEKKAVRKTIKEGMVIFRISSKISIMLML